MTQWGSFHPQPAAASVPSSAPTATPDPITQLMAQMGPQITTKEIQTATTPITGAHTAHMPSNLTTPVTPHQGTPLDYRPVVGAGNARARGIGNTVTAVMNGLGRVVTAEAQNKQNQVRDAATKVMTAQQNIDEAQQQLDMAAQSGDTATVAKMKDIIHQNTTVRDGVFSDPKMRKALAKGFNMNYIDPTQNKTSEHAAIQEAIKGLKTRQERIAAIKALKQKQNTEAAAAAGKAYATAQPQGLAPNTQAQMQLQMKMAAQKNATDIIKTVEPALIKADADKRKALIGQATELQKQATQLQNQDFLRAQQFQDRMKYLNASDAAATRRLFISSRLMLKRSMDIMNLKGASPDLVTKLALQSAKQWDTTQLSAQARLTAAQNNLSLTTAEPGSSAYVQLQSAVDQAQSNLEMVQDQADQALNIYNLKLATMGVQPIPGPKPLKSDSSVTGGTPDAATTAPGTGNNFTDYLSKTIP